MDVELVSCSVEHIQKLIEGTGAFQATYGLHLVERYLPFEGVLQYTLNVMQTSQIWYPWLPYLLILRPERVVAGIGGFKSVPDSKHTVEIGYSVAPSYQGRGLATAAARQLIEIAFTCDLVDCVSPIH